MENFRKVYLNGLQVGVLVTDDAGTKLIIKQRNNKKRYLIILILILVLQLLIAVGTYSYFKTCECTKNNDIFSISLIIKLTEIISIF
jgi:hypothetical protein